MIKKLFILSVILIPFNDFNGLSLLGELQHDMSAYFFLLTMALSATVVLHTLRSNNTQNHNSSAVYLLPRIMMWAFIIIFISFVMNFPSMVATSFRGRYSAVKFLTSALVLLYGFGIAYMSYFLAKKNTWHDLLIRPVAISVIICAVVAVIEFLSWQSGAIESLYNLLTIIIHSGSSAAAHEGFVGGAFGWGSSEGRVRSVTFEPPAFANFIGFAWPWILSGFQSAKGTRKVSYFLLLVVTTGLITLAASRTGWVLIAGNMLVLFMLRYVYLPPRLSRNFLSLFFTVLFWITTFGALFAAVYYSDDIANSIAGGESISNISRYASNTAAFRMFKESPLWGFGFGQYGFHAIHYMPNWAWYSWEIRSWFSDPMVVWPPVFSMYARFAAEVGILGLCAWIGLWYFLARKIIQTTLVYQKATGILLLQSYPLVISCFCVLFSGIPSDSLRMPLMWITLGLSCYYLQEVRRMVAVNTAMRLQSFATVNTPAFAT